MIARRKHTTFI